MGIAMATFARAQGPIGEVSLEATLPTIWTDEKALQLGRSSDVEKMRQGEDAGAQKGREVVKHCVFPLFCGSGKVGSRKRRVRSRLAR